MLLSEISLKAPCLYYELVFLRLFSWFLQINCFSLRYSPYKSVTFIKVLGFLVLFLKRLNYKRHKLVAHGSLVLHSRWWSFYRTLITRALFKWTSSCICHSGVWTAYPARHVGWKWRVTSRANSPGPTSGPFCWNGFPPSEIQNVLFLIPHIYFFLLDRIPSILLSFSLVLISSSSSLVVRSSKVERFHMNPRQNQTMGISH